MNAQLMWILFVAAGLALAFFAGRSALQRNWPICLMLAWLSLAFLLAFFRYPL